VTPDGRQLIQVTADGSFSRYRVDPNLARPLALARSAEILGSAWEIDRRATVRLVGKRRLIRVDAITGREASAMDYPEPISAYAMADAGRLMLVTTSAGARQTWSLSPEGIRVTPLVGFPTGRNVVSHLSADGAKAVVIVGANSARTMRVWDMHAGTPGPEMTYESNIYNGSLNGRFSPDGKRVAAGGVLGEAKIWDVTSGRLVYDLKPLAGQVRRVEFSSDGTRLATVELRTGGRLWDAATGEPVGPQLRHRGGIGGGISPSGFSKDGRWLMTYSQQAGSVAVWDARTGAQVGTQIEHASSIGNPVFSPDGSQILTACTDGAARLWDTQSGQLIAEPMRHPSRVTSVSFSPDGRFILTKCVDRFDRIWAVPPSAGGRAPDWLLRFATVQAGSQIDETGQTADAARELAGWEALRAEVNALPDTAPFAAWGKWLLADSTKRTLAPGFEITLAEAEARGLAVAPVTAVLTEETAAAPGVLR
jgi:WD40 repeat protein